MRYTLKSFIAGLLVTALLLSGVIVLANSSEENIQEDLMSLVPFFGYSLETEEATYTSLIYVGLFPLEKNIELQTDIDLTGALKKFGCPPVIPMKSDRITQYGEQYNIVKIDPDKLTFFAGINGHLTIKEIIGPNLYDNLPEGWGLYTSDKIEDMGSILEREFLEWKKTKIDLQEIARKIIESRMKELVREAEEKGPIQAPRPLVYERMLQDVLRIRRGPYPVMPIYPTLPALFYFDISTIAVDPNGKLEQYNIGILTLTENWPYLMEETK